MRRRSNKSGRRGPRRYDFAPILKIVGLVAAVAGLVCVVIFLIVPWIKGESVGQPDQSPDQVAVATPTPKPTPIAKEDMSTGAQLLNIEHRSINDPFVFGDEVVFTTGNKMESQPDINKIAIYNMATEATTELSGITLKYTSLFEPKMNDKFVVYLDCKSQYGGNVMGYNKETSEAFVMREYLYGKPKVTLVGEYALWMQQVGQARDKLYLYHLPTQESTTIEVFFNTPFSVSTPHMNEEAIVYVQPEGENFLLDGSSASTNAEIVVMPLSEGGDKKITRFLTGTYVYDPMIMGDYIVFLDNNAGFDSQLMFCKKEGDTYSAPEKITDGILNWDVGDGYVVYTKDDGIYIYYFKDGSTGRLSSDITKCMLGSANGKDVVWYDITDGFASGVNVIQHIKVP